MKKNIFMISLALLALVSCTNDEVVQINNGHKIGFRTAVDTRATVLGQDDLTEFYVTALTGKNEAYFSDVKFSEGSDNIFTSEKDYYWPAAGQLNFYAYYPSAEELGASISITGENKRLTGYTPNEDINEQLDFISAVASGSKADNAAGLALVFNHQLSQIEVKGLNENEGYNIYVKAISIRNVIKTGDFDFGISAWDLASYESEDAISGNLTDYTIELGEEIMLGESPLSLMGDKGNAMLIPQERPMWAVSTDTNDESGNDNVDGTAPESTNVTSPKGSYIAFKIRIETTSGVRMFPYDGDENTHAWVAHPIAFDWTPGYKYTYNCDFTDGAGVIAPDNVDPDDPNSPYTPGEDVYGGKIAVNVTFAGWTYESNSNDNLYDSYQEVPMGTEDEE